MLDKVNPAITLGKYLCEQNMNLSDITASDGELKADEGKKLDTICRTLNTDREDLKSTIKELLTSTASDIVSVRQELQDQGLIPKPEATPAGKSDSAGGTTPDVDEPSGAHDNPDTASTSIEETQDDTTQKEGFWTSWGTIVLGVLGVLAWIGALFSSEEGTKGKTIFGGIGGLLLGGALVSQWPSAGKLFGRAIEAVKNVIQGEGQETQPT